MSFGKRVYTAPVSAPVEKNVRAMYASTRGAEMLAWREVQKWTGAKADATPDLIANVREILARPAYAR